MFYPLSSQLYTHKTDIRYKYTSSENERDTIKEIFYSIHRLFFHYHFSSLRKVKELCRQSWNLSEQISIFIFCNIKSLLCTSNIIFWQWNSIVLAYLYFSFIQFYEFSILRYKILNKNYLKAFRKICIQLFWSKSNKSTWFDIDS